MSLFICRLFRAPVLTESSSYSHFTLLLIRLHRLPINVHVKILGLTFRVMHGQAQLYISELLHPWQVPWSHVIRACRLCIIQGWELNEKQFRLWNSLSHWAWDCWTLISLKKKSLKNFRAFSQNYFTLVWLSWSVCKLAAFPRVLVCFHTEKFKWMSSE